MDIYTEEVRCGLCGAKALALAGANVWDGREFFHKDPFVCQRNLKTKLRAGSPGAEGPPTSTSI
jgi:hypothetical protein